MKQKAVIRHEKHERGGLSGRAAAFLSVILIAALGFLAYGSAIDGKFIWDDRTFVRDNAFLKDWRYIPTIFRENLLAGAGRSSSFYRPFQALTYMADTYVWGQGARGYHITNILLHVLAALALFWLVLVLFESRVLALFTGALFVTHPIHTEAVCYITGRADALAAFWMLLSFIFYVKRGSTRSVPVYLLMALSFLCALASKEYGLILPALILVYHYAFRKRVLVFEFVSLLGIALIYSVYRSTAVPLTSPYTLQSTTLAQRLPGFFVSIAEYLKILLLPFGLHMEYGSRLFRYFDPRALAGMAISAGALFYVMKGRQTGVMRFSILWFFVALLPVANLYPINAFMAEHWLYVPSMGFFLAVGKILSRFSRDERTRAAAIAAFAGFLVFYVTLTRAQGAYWSDPVTFFERTLKFAPASPRLMSELGTEYANRGRMEDAIGLLEKAIALDPWYTEAYGNLGNVYMRVGKKEEAVGTFRKLMEIDPNDARAYNNLANIFLAEGDFREASSLYRKAIEKNPKLAQAYINLANALCALGDDEEAVAACRRAIRLDSRSADAYNNLGNAYRNMGRSADAIAAYTKALELRPGFALSHMNLSLVYYDEKRYDLAVAHCDRAVASGYAPDKEYLELLRRYRQASP